MSTALRSLLAEQLAPIIGGDLTDGHGQRRAIVAAATSAGHPLHERFEWDDEVAGDEYRLIQAGRLIRVAVVRVDTDEEPLVSRAFVSVPTPTGRRYLPTEDVAVDGLLTQITLREMEMAWRRLKRLYGAREEFWRLVRSEHEE